MRSLVHSACRIRARGYTRPGESSARRKVPFSNHPLFAERVSPFNDEMRTEVVENCCRSREEAVLGLRGDSRLFEDQLGRFQAFSLMLHTIFSMLIATIGTADVSTHSSANQFPMSIIRSLFELLFDVS